MDNSETEDELITLGLWVIVNKAGIGDLLAYEIVRIEVDELHDFHVIFRGNLDGLTSLVLGELSGHFLLISWGGEVGAGVWLQVLNSRSLLVGLIRIAPCRQWKMISLSWHGISIQGYCWHQEPREDWKGQENDAGYLGYSTWQMRVNLHLLHPNDELNHSKDKGKHHGNVGQVGVVDVNVLVELARNLQVHDELKIPR